GANGEGKSTIADAIAYAFCGTPFWGEKSCERLQNNECGEMAVEVQLVDECGEVHTLTRRRNGSNTTIVFDTMTVRQSDVVNFFAEKDVFLSLLNPLYFIEKIAEDGREFLQKLVPVVKQEDILAQMSDSERTLLEHESLLDPEYFIKQRREELKEYEESTVYLEGQRDLLNQQYDEAVAKLDAALKRGNEIVAR
ncbi:MAG: AAA family ATPase, partial [Clostridia bacterium]|nr:AAA family ATPase [Clostridia bacterium]